MGARLSAYVPPPPSGTSASRTKPALAFVLHTASAAGSARPSAPPATEKTTSCADAAPAVCKVMENSSTLAGVYGLKRVTTAPPPGSADMPGEPTARYRQPGSANCVWCASAWMVGFIW